MTPGQTTFSRSLVIFWIAVSAALGIATHSPYAFAIAESGIILLAGSYLLVSLVANSFQAKRIHLASCLEGAALDVRITLRGEGWLKAGFVELRAPFAASLSPAATFLLTSPPTHGEEVALEHRVKIDKTRGRYENGPLTARVRDPLGIWTREFKIAAPSTLAVYPRPFQVGHLELKGQSDTHHVGQHTTAKAGVSGYFFGTREYRRGDPLRFIHWASSAHRRRLVVKEFELSVATEVSIFLDLHQETFQGMGRRSTLERAVAIAASVASYSLNQGNAVGLFAAGSEPTIIPHRSGSAHFRFILEALSRAKADGTTPLCDLIQSELHRISRESSVVVIWNGIEMEYKDYEKIFHSLKGHSVKPVAIFVDDTSFLRRAWGAETVDALSLARREERERMAAAGIDVYVVPPEADPSSLFRAPWQRRVRK